MTWQPENERRLFNEAVTSIPDVNSQEMIVYGSAYMQVKLQLRTIDRIIDVLETKITDTMAKLDFTILDKVQNIAEYDDIVYRGISAPPDMSESELQTIENVRTIAHHVHAIAVLRDRKDRIIEVGRTIGAAEHSARINARGPTQPEWQMSAMRFDATNPVASDPIDISYEGDVE